MKKLREGFTAMSTAKKIETAAAVILTLAIIVGVPVFAWLATTTEVEVLTKVRKPDNLDITAGNGDPIINFDLRDIDVKHPDTETETTASKYYVFSVSAGGYNIPYIIQIAHTTNIPFTYNLYRAKKLGENDSLQQILYTVYRRIDGGGDGETNYQIVGQNLLTKTLNGDEANVSTYGRLLGKNNDKDYYYQTTYITNDPNDNNDTPQVYAIPLYHQTVTLQRPEEDSDGLFNDDYDYYVLELTWKKTDDTEGFKQWNIGSNNKETDIIYISAAVAMETEDTNAAG